MEYLESPSHDPQWNLALEQYVFDAMDRSKSYFMLWQNENTIVVGKNQNTVAEINSDFVRERGITVVRRLSGGGAVYHDLGNLNFTFIVDSAAAGQINFRLFCQPIVDTLASFGVKAELSGRNDITVEGKKFSGNSQYVREHRVMHHGTLMFDSDLTVLGQALRVKPEKMQSKGVRSVASRVTNLRPYLPPQVTLQEFKERLLRQIAAGEALHPCTLTPADLAAVESIRQRRYATWQWNYGASPAYTVNRSQRIEGCGTVELSMEVQRGAIGRMQFFGDFFGNGDPAELAARLAGCPCSRSAVLERLQAVEVGHYFHNLTAAQLAELIAP